MEILGLLRAILLLTPLVVAEGLYSKSSSVLQVNAGNYNRLIEKSNYTSIVEFYAPWCGHCKNLKPAYEKAASSLQGYAKVAAVNCDDDSNKPFCGGMGVQGFPTLKLIKPKKKGGKPLVEDYQGARTAKGIKEAVLDKIPNHVQKITDKDVEQFMKKEGKPKAVFFTDKGSVSPMVKSIAIDFLGKMEVAQINSKEKKATELFMVKDFPKAFIMMSSEHIPEVYQGELQKEPLVEFFEKSGAVQRNPEWSADTPKAKKAKMEQKDKKSNPHGDSKKGSSESCPMAGGASESVVEESANPTATASPNPNVASESPAPVHVPVETAPELRILDSESALQKSCLNTKSGICVLAFISKGADTEKTGITSLSEIAHKHAQRKAKIFPFYAVPETNDAAQTLLGALDIKQPSAHATIVAINAKRGWWTRYAGEEIGQQVLETWIDNIRFGDFTKKTLPNGLVKEVEEDAKKEEEGEDPQDIKVDFVEEIRDEL